MIYVSVSTMYARCRIMFSKWTVINYNLLIAETIWCLAGGLKYGFLKMGSARDEALQTKLLDDIYKLENKVIV